MVGKNALNVIVSKARQVDELATEVASASCEQTQGITQINVAIGQVDKVTQSNASSAEESAAAAEELNAQAATMKQSVIELLKLVGGGGLANNRIAVAPPTKASPKVKLVPLLSVQNGSNGHTHAAPKMASTENERSQIPLEGDFKDF
ncbi:MAG TPA: hypothetical protein VL970_08625 [Candidatus Acidoferrales bacterium]|nr:hypothetical protein [Candidatus Acidoferrales bacterium]